MNAYHSILDILEQNSNKHPNTLAFAALKSGSDVTTSLTYRQLRQSVAALASDLKGMTERGDRVMLLYDHTFEFLVPFLACLYAGLIAVPAPLPNTFTAKRVLARMQSILQDAQPVLVLTTSEQLAAMESTIGDLDEFSSIKWLTTDQSSNQTTDWTPVTVQKHDVAYLQYTSGSTSTPKGVVVTHGNIIHQVDYLHRVWTENGYITGMTSWMPYYHDMGLFSGILYPLYAAIPSYLLSPVTFIRHPEYWLAAVSNFKTSHTVGPVFAYELCTRKLTVEQRAGLDLSCLKMACLGAEPIQPGIVNEFIAAYRPYGFSPDAMIPGFGLAEATLAVTVTPLHGGPVMASFDKTDLARRRVAPATGPGATLLVSSGRALADVPVHIVNENTYLRCAQDEIGEIWLGGESIADGYWQKKEENRRTFQAHIADTNEGPFLRTGDLGFFHDGMIYIAGRIKDMMIFQGQNIYPQDIEWVVQESHPNLQKGACASFSVDLNGHENLVVCQEISEKKADPVELEKIASSIRRAVAVQHGLSVYAVVLLRRGTIPKTSSGKIQRHVARNDFVNGKMDSVVHVSYGETVLDESSTPGSDLEAELVKIMEEVLKVSPVGVEQDFFERGGDSLGFLLLVEHVEERLGMAIPLDQPVKNLSARSLARLLTKEESLVAETVLKEDQPGKSNRRGKRNFLRSFREKFLKALPYEFVDGLLRWLSRQSWFASLQYKTESNQIKQIVSELEQPTAHSDAIARWIYCEMFYQWRIASLRDSKQISRRVHVSGMDHLNHARSTGRGTVLLMSNVGVKHLAVIPLLKGLANGNGYLDIEDVMQVGGRKGSVRMAGVPQMKEQFLLNIEDELVKSNSHLSFQLAKGKRVLEEGGILIIAGDGQRGLRKIELPFLKRRRPFGTGFAEIALTTDSIVLPVFTFLREDGHAEVQCFAPLTVPESDHATQVRGLLKQYVRLLETYWKEALPNVRRKMIHFYLSLPLKQNPN